MVNNEKTKIGLVILIFIILTFVVITLRNKSMTVNVIYLRKSSCIIINQTDRIMEEFEDKFGSELSIKTVDLDHEQNITKEDRDMINKYQIIGIPLIIINGKEYRKGFTEKNIKREICRSFLIKPEECK